MKDRQSILRSRWIRPFAHLFGHPSLWHLNRRSVPRALAVGLFAAFILPIGQFILSALVAVPLRANVPLAAAATLVTNPLTVPAIYYAAFRLGDFLLDQGGSREAGDFASSMGARLLDVSGPTALGLVIFALVGAAAGYLVGSAWWRLKLTKRWRERRPLRRRKAGGERRR
ncbi:MAG TPA: DUF2062 domain-containing protein [Sphingomicrobium sp.]|nr:DUF2062 domain-containing protein [Sphingomicrobium sp.]